MVDVGKVLDVGGSVWSQGQQWILITLLQRLLVVTLDSLQQIYRSTWLQLLDLNNNLSLTCKIHSDFYINTILKSFGSSAALGNVPQVPVSAQ